MLEQFSIEKFESDGFWYISPKSTENNGKYLIQCDSEEGGSGIVQQINNGSLADPINAQPGAYDKLGEFLSSSQGRYTPVYRIKS